MDAVARDERTEEHRLGGIGDVPEACHLGRRAGAVVVWLDEQVARVELGVEVDEAPHVVGEAARDGGGGGQDNRVCRVAYVDDRRALGVGVRLVRAAVADVGHSLTVPHLGGVADKLAEIVVTDDREVLGRSRRRPGLAGRGEGGGVDRQAHDAERGEQGLADGECNHRTAYTHNRTVSLGFWAGKPILIANAVRRQNVTAR